ncbi:MAG: glycosyltransferase [Candidatus Eremiobacteraeota bacterium]|nr:glycosyltransferase [Candidatus Eremiobacteraeota bacterium]
MNALFICQQNPWRLNGGALIRNYWLVRALAEGHSVDLFTADTSETPPEDFARVCRTISCFPRAGGLRGRISRALSSLRPHASYYTSGNVPRALRRAVAERLARGDEPLVMYDLAMRDALPSRARRTIYNAHNCESELLARRAERERLPARFALGLDARRVRGIETAAVRGAEVVAACSDDDRRDLARLAPDALARIAFVPNGVDVARYASLSPEPLEPRTLLLTGSFDWRPNRLGLDWFLETVLPALRARLQGTAYRVRVAGRLPAEVTRRLIGLGVEAVPYPPDMRPELEKADVVAAAVVASSGTRLRILEAWAAGRPVVTTPAGAFGLDHVAGRDLAVADGGEAFAGDVARLFEDRERWRAMRAAALERVRDYDWPAIGRDFAALLQERAL